MAGMELTLTNVMNFFSSISPLLLGFCIVLISIINQNIKGIIYLGGVLLASVINLFIANMIKSIRSPEASPTCSLIDFPFVNNVYNSPAFNSVFIAFTLAYLLLPMIYNNQMNYILAIFLISLFFLDAFTKFMKKCVNVSGILLGGLFGLLFGGIWFTIFYASGNEHLLFFNEMSSNNVVCERPKKQKFKCAVYKNGTLLKKL